MNTKIILLGVLAIAVIGALFLLPQSRNMLGDKTETSVTSGEVSENTVSSSGIHWHPEVSITIKNEKQVIPANIGIGMQYAGYPQYDPMMMMTNMHTHDTSGQLHWEVMEGPVEKEDVRLGAFFAVWGRAFSKDCIFEFCNGLNGTVRMLVNGKENIEFENYQVKDKDKIEVRYE